MSHSTLIQCVLLRNRLVRRDPYSMRLTPFVRALSSGALIVTGGMQPSSRPEEDALYFRMQPRTFSNHPLPSQPVQPLITSVSMHSPILDLCLCEWNHMCDILCLASSCSKMWSRLWHGPVLLSFLRPVTVHPVDIAGSGIHSPAEAGGRLLPCDCCE